jgi:FSR family fosmidomycin resistance protein-like MFS transporter|tara:strand:+ start:220 stop:1422 length:1203 start_codon:yes stop_codon:yes gene_type:complete
MDSNIKQPRLITFYAATGHLMMHMFAAFYFVIVLAIEDDWNFSYDELINLWLLGSLLVGLGSIPAGWLSDRWSRSGMLAIMFIGLGTSSILCGFSNNKFSLMINLSALGLFCSIYHPAGISWVVNTSKETGRALGFNNIFGGVGIGLGAFSSGLIIDMYNWNYAFIFPGLISIIIGIGLFLHIYQGKISFKNIISDKFNDNPEQNQLLKIAIIMLVSITCMSFVYQILQSSLPKVIDIRLAEKFDFGASQIGLIVSFIYIVSGLMNYIGGILADKYPEKNIYLIGILGQGILLFFIFSLSNYFLIIISLFIVAFNSSILPAENLLLAYFSPQKHQSLVYGIKFIVSFAIAPIALFLISTSYEVTKEFSYLYLSSGILMLILFFVVFTLPSAPKKSISEAF